MKACLNCGEDIPCYSEHDFCFECRYAMHLNIKEINRRWGIEVKDE